LLQFGIPFGLLAALIVLERDPFIWDLGRHTTSPAFNLIHFSNTALILGFLSLFSIHWEGKDHPSLVILKLCGFLSGLYISIQSGERGGWIVIPLLLMLFTFSHSNKYVRLKSTGAILAIAAFAWLGYSNSEIMHNRIDAVFLDINEYANGNKDTSIGIRLQLYLAALRLFIDQPIFGIGSEGFQHAILSLQHQETLTPGAIHMAASEVHNEILAKCVGAGIFGLLSILAVYTVPLLIFQSRRKTTSSLIKIASTMGICLVAGFFMFGLTVEIFNLKMTATFFAFTIAILMAAATHQDAAHKQDQ
jgi:O-antigen ligase